MSGQIIDATAIFTRQAAGDDPPALAGSVVLHPAEQKRLADAATRDVPSPAIQPEPHRRNTKGWIILRDPASLDRVLHGLTEEWLLSPQEAKFCRELRGYLARSRSEFALSEKQVAWLVALIAATEGEFSWREGREIMEEIADG